MTAYVNYPLTAGDDDEFFDAPAGSTLINADGVTVAAKIGDGWDWRNNEEFIVQTGDLWASLFADGNPFGDHDITPGYVLRVPLWFAEPRDMTEGGAAEAERRAEARVAAMFAGA